MTSKNSKNISAMEARKRFGEIMDRVSLRGEIFTIARAGKPMARIVPMGLTDVGDVFDRPFTTFTEWNDAANDAYNEL